MSADDRWVARTYTDSIDGLELRQPILLGYEPLGGEGVLVAGEVINPQEGRDPIPKSLRKRFTKKQSPSYVELGGVEAFAYEGEVKSGAAGAGNVGLSLFMVPTEAGVEAIACMAPAASFSQLSAPCEEVASTVHFKGAKANAVVPDTNFASELSATLDELNGKSSQALKALDSATDSDAQAGAAESVADAYRAAAQDLQKLKVPAQDAGAVKMLAEALERLGTGFGELASAARDENGRRYSAAKNAVNEADVAVRDAIVTLADNGYALQ